MIEIKVIPQTACLMLMNDNELISSKFYNKFKFDNGEIDNIQLQQDAQQMINEYLKTHINNMLEYYRWHDRFKSKDLDLLMELADFTGYEISKLINKFHYINTRIADNGGVPVLKQILQLI